MSIYPPRKDAPAQYGYLNDQYWSWFADIVSAKDDYDNLYVTYIGFKADGVAPTPWNIVFQKVRLPFYVNATVQYMLLMFVIVI